ncbi:MAG: type II toxin-antitoxin system VapC family toxin [Pseudanabaena sp.]|jgi:PIN domain nuclease of toxin-antitoxin system
MRVLIDTHAFIWYIQNNEKLPSPIFTLINDGGNEVLFSTASIWEMAIKQSTGKLNLGLPYASFIKEQMKLNSIELLPIKLEHLELVTSLPFHHRDPFDRLLIAQAMVEALPIVSVDNIFSSYPVQIIWN